MAPKEIIEKMEFMLCILIPVLEVIARMINSSYILPFLGGVFDSVEQIITGFREFQKMLAELKYTTTEQTTQTHRNLLDEHYV